jgi:stage II sporulation protein D
MSAALMVAVVVLAKHQPDRLAVEGCGSVTSLRATREGVEVCGRGCRIEPSVALTCPGGARVRAPSLPARTYGRTLRVSVENGALRAVSDIELEPYVAGVVASEMAGAPGEARKALAIVARSYALAAKRSPRHADADLCDLTHCQVLHSIGEDPLLASTSGRTLEGPVFFHSTCGGRTHDAHRVWPDLTTTDLIGVGDLDPSGEPYCRASPHFRWMAEIGEADLSRAISGIAGKRDPASLELIPRDDRIEIRDRSGSTSVAAHRLHLELGRSLGWSRIKSPFFEVERAGRSFRLRGSGLGHGVGLCQYGAIERARRGADADEILRAYFPNLVSPPFSTPAVEIDGGAELHDRWRTACEAVARELPGGRGTWRVEVRQAESIEEFVSRTGRSRFEAAAFTGGGIWLSAKPILDRFGDLDPILRHECVHARLRFLGLPPLPRVIEEGLAVGIAGQASRMPPAAPFAREELRGAERSLAQPVDRTNLEVALARAHATVWPKLRERSPASRLSFLREIVFAGSAWTDRF